MVFKWSSIRALGNSRTVKSSYYWLVVVPLAAKFLEKIEGEYTFSIFESDLTFYFGLPFSWQLFYLMAVAFAIGQAAFQLRCPEYIRDFASFLEYRQAHLGTGPLLRFLNFANRRTSEKDHRSMHKRIVNALENEDHDLDDLFERIYSASENENNHLKEDIYEHYRAMILARSPSDEIESDVFYAVALSSQRIRPISLGISLFSFAIGMSLLMAVMIQNFIYVVNRIM